MMTLVITIHVIICVLLILIILIQAGRGGGLVESFSGVESMFGTKTNAFLTRATTVLSVAFFITCLSLAFLAARQSRSLMPITKPQVEQKEPSAAKETQPKEEPGKAPLPVAPEAKPQGATQPEQAKP